MSDLKQRQRLSPALALRERVLGPTAQFAQRRSIAWRATAVSVAIVLLLMLAGCGSVVASTEGTITPLGERALSAVTGDGYTVESFATTIPSFRADVIDDPATVYYPTNTDAGAIPVALMLQGAGVEAKAYDAYAREVAAFGFVVVVPDHRRLLFGSTELYAEQSQVIDTVAWMKAEKSLATSPFASIIDPSTLVLMGHSFGGATGLSAVEDNCRLPFCIVKERDYPARPVELKAAALYGTNLASPLGDEIPAVSTAGIPVAFIQGSLDAATTPTETTDTYNQMSGGPVAIATLTGANHYAITDAATAEAAGSASTAMPQDVSITTAARWTALYLLSFLGDSAATAAIQAEAANNEDPLVTLISKN